MKRLFAPFLLLLLSSATRQVLGESDVELILVDGSRLMGNLTIDSATIKPLDAPKIDVPFSQVRHIKLWRKIFEGGGSETRAIVTKKENRPKKVRGKIDWSSVNIDTIFGKFDIDIEHVRKLLVVSTDGDDGTGEQQEEGTISFGGVNWHPWRTAWEIQGDKLVSLPKARAGFDYGHSGHGRGPILATNVGNKDWKDYSVRFKVGMPGVDPSFNPYGLRQTHDAKFVGVYFHAADAKESWNEKGLSSYRLNISEERRSRAPYNWSLAKSYNAYSNRPKGWGNIFSQGREVLAESEEGNMFDGRQGCTVQIDVVGNRIQIWINDEKVVDVADEQMGEDVGGQTLDHGGIVILTPWEDMIWISDFSIEHL